MGEVNKGSFSEVAAAGGDDSLDLRIITVTGLAFSIAGAVSLALIVQVGAPQFLVILAIVGATISIIGLRAAGHRRRRDIVVPLIGTVVGCATLLAVIGLVLWIFVIFSISPP